MAMALVLLSAPSDYHVHTTRHLVPSVLAPFSEPLPATRYGQSRFGIKIHWGPYAVPGYGALGQYAEQYARFYRVGAAFHCFFDCLVDCLLTICWYNLTRQAPRAAVLKPTRCDISNDFQ